jgi:selenoprotein W-related protein
VKVQLIADRGGVFDVTLDGVLVFSKHQAGRHAEPGELVKLMREAVSSRKS